MKLPVNYKTTSNRDRKIIREEYVRVQEGNCYHCDAPLSEEPKKEVKDMQVDREFFPNGFFNWPVHLHHSHVTDMTLGAVHCHCNAVLWQYLGE